MGEGVGWRYILGVRDWVDIFFEWVGGVGGGIFWVGGGEWGWSLVLA